MEERGDSFTDEAFFPFFFFVFDLTSGVKPGVGRGFCGRFQSEKRLAKDCRRLRMVSALASSSVRFPRNVSVKVLVSDWDLLHNIKNNCYYGVKGKGHLVHVSEEDPAMGTDGSWRIMKRLKPMK